jgi:hypothetical protein
MQAGCDRVRGDRKSGVSRGGFHRGSRYPCRVQPSLLFPTQPELTPEIPPTWAEASDVFHITERCSRLQAIRPNNRVTGRPGVAMRRCYNCEDIIRTKRAG